MAALESMKQAALARPLAAGMQKAGSIWEPAFDLVAGAASCLAICGEPAQLPAGVALRHGCRAKSSVVIFSVARACHYRRCVLSAPFVVTFHGPKRARIGQGAVDRSRAAPPST